MKVTSKVACGFKKRSAYKHPVSFGFLHHIKARQFSPIERDFDLKWRLSRQEFVQNLCEDLEAWWSEHLYELESEAVPGNCRKPLRLIRVTHNIDQTVLPSIACDD